MTANTGPWADLHTSLRQDIEVTISLQKLLDQEREALEQRDYDGFNQLLGNKQQLLQQLEQHAGHRQQLLKNAGFSDDQQALDQAERQAPATAKLWRTLLEQWQKCQQQNEVNERVAQRTRQVVGQVLDMLRGRTASSRTYDASGTAKSYNSGLTITSA